MLGQAALLGGQHLDLLLHLRHGGGLLAGGGLCGAMGVFQAGQGVLLLFELRGKTFGLFFGLRVLLCQLFGLRLGLGLAARPFGGLLFQLRQALGGALAVFQHEADFGFQLAHFGAGLIQQALGLIDFAARFVVGLAHGFQIGLHAAQVGAARFQIVAGLVGVGLQVALPLLGLAALEKPLLVLAQGGGLLQLVVLARDFGLLLQLFKVGVQLA